MNETVEVSKLLELKLAMPGRVHAAAQAVEDAEQRLARVLTLRAAGQATKASETSVARMALTRALRDAEDLQRIQSALPVMLELARGAARARSAPAVHQTWTGATEVQCA